MKILKMKNVKRVFLFVAIITATIFSYMPKALTADYLGELCWSLHSEGSTNEARLMRVGMTHMGDSGFTLQGVIDDPNIDPAIDPAIMNGAAVIVGNEVFFTMNISQDLAPYPWRDTGNGQLRLNLPTLNGTFWVNYLEFDVEFSEFWESHESGTVTFTNCP